MVMCGGDVIATPVLAADGIALGARAVPTTPSSITGVDTATAHMTAVVTQADLDLCAERGGDACATGDRPGRTYSVSADCAAGTVVDVDGQAYRRQGSWAAGETPADFWAGRPRFEDASGKTVSTANAAQGGPLAINYERLCPAASKPTVASAKSPTSGRAEILNTADLDGRVVWDHNGSEMLIDADKGVIVYNQPKTSIRKAVQIGQVLFRGNLVPDGPVSGTAYVFKAGCAPAPYAVKGRWSNETGLVLTGSAPRRSKVGCGIDGYSATGGNAKLRFTFLYSP